MFPYSPYLGICKARSAAKIQHLRRLGDGIESKETGSWNLHALLPPGLDFFVLVASLNGIVGGCAQANYAAGNTFQDALAQYRLSLSEKAVSLDLGLILSEGVVAEDKFLLASMRRLGHLMDISQGELLTILDYYCDPALPLLSSDQAQILIGLETPAAVQAKGIDLYHSTYRPVFRQLFCSGPSLTDTGTLNKQNIGINRIAALHGATLGEQATEMVLGWFIAKIAQVLGLDVSDIDPEKPIHTYGNDSLVTMDLKNWLTREFGVEMQVFLLLGNTPIQEIAKDVALRSTHRSDERTEKI
jgi:acyl carrier protein